MQHASQSRFMSIEVGVYKMVTEICMTCAVMVVSLCPHALGKSHTYSIRIILCKLLLLAALIIQVGVSTKLQVSQCDMHCSKCYNKMLNTAA